MHLIEYLRLAKEYEKSVHHESAAIRIAIVTNFTDDFLQKIVTGMCMAEGIRPSVYVVPFKQYLFEFKNTHSSLATFAPDITFVFFDANAYHESEFSIDQDHGRQVLEDVKAYSRVQKGLVVVHTIVEPSSIQHNRLLQRSNLHNLAKEYQQELAHMAQELPNVRVLEVNALVRLLGEQHARDMRNLYAFSQPFSHEFLASVAREWMTYIRALRGKIRKCIVVDLDHTLWGGVLGEVGPLGVDLGPDYPGNAFQQFQRVLLELYERGVILAINSRNNMADVDEMFEKNTHMILQKSHFASIVANWKSKAENVRTIAQELNIGLDSMVFIDDDPMNRDLVVAQLPEVLTPDWSMPPEEYPRALLNLDLFHSEALTAEDLERGHMYAKEHERRSLQSTVTLDEYKQQLKVVVDVSLNDPALMPRLAQLTQKTNQFNLTTVRMTEHEIVQCVDEGALMFAGDVHDRFGPYGVTVLAIACPKNETEIELLNFLMSCRVMGRGVEHTFFERMVIELQTRGFKRLTALFVPSLKNTPAASFLSDVGATITKQTEKGTYYEFVLSDRAELRPL